MENGEVLVAVHAGAGYHSSEREKEYTDTCKAACIKALTLLQDGGLSIDAVAEAVAVLEDAPCTNAGLGSSLTLDGGVECDASIMDGKTLLFGAVGALTDHSNPVKLAHALTKAQMKGSLSCGRIPPSVLVGGGASKWAASNGFSSVDPESLITDSSRQTYLKYKRKVEAAESCQSPQRKRMKTAGAQETKESLVLDTVGAVCLDRHGNLAAAASSGGIWLKHPGRLGPAAMYGAGCWACNVQSDDATGVAVAVSGSGEHVMRNLLAKTCAESVQMQTDTTIAVEKSFEDQFGGVVPAGILALSHNRCNKTAAAELLWSHTTDSMAIGFASGKSKHPKTFISRLSSTTEGVKSLAIGGKCFHL